MQEETQQTEVRESVSQDGNATVQRQTVSKTHKMSYIVLAQRIVWLIVGIVNVLIGLRFIFLLLGANPDAGFTDFVYSVSAPFVAPFVGIFGEPVYGKSVFEISSLLAILIYVLIGIGIAKLLTLARPQDEV